MLAFIIYLIGILQYAIGTAIGIAIASGIIWIVSWIIELVSHPSTNYYAATETQIKEYKAFLADVKIQSRRKIAFWIFVGALLVAVLLPNSKTVIAMYLVPKIVNNEKVCAIPDKALTIFNLKLDEWISDMQKDLGVTNTNNNATGKKK